MRAAIDAAGLLLLACLWAGVALAIVYRGAGL